MVDEDLRQQLREISGQDVASCDVCGRPVARTELVVISTAHPAVEQADEVRVCPTCYAAIERGEITLDDEDNQPPASRLI